MSRPNETGILSSPVSLCFLRVRVDQMPHHRIASKITLYSPLEFPAGLSLPLVLA